VSDEPLDWSDPRRQVRIPPGGDTSYEAINEALTQRELELMIDDYLDDNDQDGPR
jgi:hypothetical protein